MRDSGIPDCLVWDSIRFCEIKTCVFIQPRSGSWIHGYIFSQQTLVETETPMGDILLERRYIATQRHSVGGSFESLGDWLPALDRYSEDINAVQFVSEGLGVFSVVREIIGNRLDFF